MLIYSNIVTWRQNGKKKRDITVVCIAWHTTALKNKIKISISGTFCEESHLSRASVNWDSHYVGPISMVHWESHLTGTVFEDRSKSWKFYVKIYYRKYEYFND